MELRPMVGVPTTMSDMYSEIYDQGSTIEDTQTQESQPTLYHGQTPPTQPQASGLASRTGASANEAPTVDATGTDTTRDSPQPTAHPMPVQASVHHPATPPAIMSLVVSPITASAPPLLSGHASSHSTRSTSSTPTTSESSVDPTSTASDAADASPSLSQNPPIIVGILMASLIGLAAMIALVSWLTRSSRRRRRNRMENTKSEVGSISTEAGQPSFAEKEVEESEFEYSQSNRIEPPVPVYTEPQPAVFSHENYPNGDDLYNSMHTPSGAYLPSLPTIKTGPPRNGLNGPVKAQASSYYPQPRGIHKSSWQDAPQFLKLDDTDMVGVPAHKDQQALSDPVIKNDNIPDSTHNIQPPPAEMPPPGFSWANAFRHNLVSALDVVKHATSAKISQPPSTSNQSDPSTSSEDKFTPLALRPARQSLGRFPLQDVQVDDNLTFGTGWMPKGSRTSSTNSSRTGSEDRSDQKGTLGRFSFEQRMGRGKGAEFERRPGRKMNSRLAVHSTALSRRRSGMASGSGSSVHSTTSSESASDVTMRKRRPGVE